MKLDWTRDAALEQVLKYGIHTWKMYLEDSRQACFGGGGAMYRKGLYTH